MKPVTVKLIIYRKCQKCGWWQVRAETATTFVFTPCEQHDMLTQYGRPLSEQMNKADVEIVDE